MNNEVQPRPARTLAACLRLLEQIYWSSGGPDGADPAESRVARAPLEVLWDFADVLRAGEARIKSCSSNLEIEDLEAEAAHEMTVSNAIRTLKTIRDRETLVLFETALDLAREEVAKASDWRSIREDVP